MTLFLGLVYGSINVEVVAAEGVSTAQLLLDGRQVAVLRPPWQTTFDLGTGLAPHELVAVALDRDGREVGRARQWINRPRALAEASFVLEPGTGGERRIARLAWRCLTSEAPPSITVSLDGKPVAVHDPRCIELPPHDPAQVHVLHAELAFEGKVTATADAAFGGAQRSEALVGLTAVPIVLEAGATAPPSHAFDGWFARRGLPLSVAAVEEGPALVVFVLTRSARKHLRRIRFSSGGAPCRPAADDDGPCGPRLGKDQQFRFLLAAPESQVQSRDVVDVFPSTKDFSPYDGVLGFGARISRSEGFAAERVAEAVGIAGLAASARDRRRAVVLLVGSDTADASGISGRDATLFLARLGVPFQVWSVGTARPRLGGLYGDVVDASTFFRFERATRALATALDRQRIIWLEGTFPPHEVELTAQASGIALVR